MNRSRPLLEESCMLLLFFGMFISWNYLGQNDALAQANRNSKAQPAANQKNMATLRANESPEGSRVSVSSDATLDEYEAYRRGDRFYVKLPATEVSQVAKLRARGFEDVSVQKSGSSTVLSFHLQPGTTARVDQKGNHLDVIFTTPRGAQGSLTTPPASNSDSPNAASSLDNAAGNVPDNAKGQSAVVTNSANLSSKTGSNAASPSSSPSAQSANQNTLNPQSAGDSWLGSGDWRSRLKFYAEMAKLNWLPILIGLTVVLLLIAVWLSRRSKGRRSKEIVSLPRKLKTHGDAAAKATPNLSGSTNEQLSDMKPLAASAPKLGPAVGVESVSKENVDVAGAQAEASTILAGGKSADQPTGVDTGAREVIATELLSALAGRNPERRDRAREAFINSGYFDDATRDLRVAEAPAERASAARKLALVRDPEATPHLIVALEDEAPEVRRAAVEALADVRDPAAIASLNELLTTERDRKVPPSVIRHAIEACATVEPPTTDQSTAPNISSAIIEPDREVIEI